MTPPAGIPRLIGMIHLSPLPGSPGFEGSFDRVIEKARAEAELLAGVGFTGLMVENFGDVPFYADLVPPVTVAAMSIAVAEVRKAVDVPVGVNVLRNDAAAAVSIAAATGAEMVRVNVLSGTMYTDQGPVVGKAAEVVRLRSQLAPRVKLLADVMVKHATPPPGLTLEQAALDLWQRGGADGLVVSGSGTGAPVELDGLRRLRKLLPDAPLLIGSGARPENLGELAELADGVIVGTALERGGVPGAPVERERAEELVGAARQAGLL